MLQFTSGETAGAPCETPLMDNNSKPTAEDPPALPQPHPQTPTADTQKVAFKLGGSEEADLDNNDMETKDLDAINGERYKQKEKKKVFPLRDIWQIQVGC